MILNSIVFFVIVPVVVPAESWEDLTPLSFIWSLLFNTDISYFKFLNRVHYVELSLCAQQLWDVPHPWLNIFVLASSMTTFDSLVFQQLVPVEYDGPPPCIWDSSSRHECFVSYG